MIQTCLTSLIDRYQHRPREVQSMCLAEFAATFVTNYRQSDDSECDTLPPAESETMSKTIQLTDGFGKMNRRKRQAIIKFLPLVCMQGLKVLATHKK